MNKFVNIYPSRPIIELNPPIRCISKGLLLSEESIKICISSGAVVEEIIDKNHTIALNENNYNKDNTAKQEEPVVEQSKQEKEIEEKIAAIDAKVENKNSYNNFNNKKNKHKNKHNNYQFTKAENHVEEQKEDSTNNNTVDTDNDVKVD